MKKDIPDNTIAKFQKAVGIEVTGKWDKATKEYCKTPTKASAKWLKEEVGDIAEFQTRNHMAIHGEADYFTIERYLQQTNQ